MSFPLLMIIPSILPNVLDLIDLPSSKLITFLRVSHRFFRKQVEQGCVACSSLGLCALAGNHWATWTAWRLVNDGQYWTILGNCWEHIGKMLGTYGLTMVHGGQYCGYLVVNCPRIASRLVHPLVISVDEYPTSPTEITRDVSYLGFVGCATK